VDGPDLEQWLASERPAAVQALRAAEALASAVRHVHERGLVHRDIKPANVRLTAAGTLKLCDFGLTTTLEAADAERLPTHRADVDALARVVDRLLAESSAPESLRQRCREGEFTDAGELLRELSALSAAAPAAPERPPSCALSPVRERPPDEI